MSAAAIVMMLIAIAVIWGGLALAILNISRSPANPSESSADFTHRDL